MRLGLRYRSAAAFRKEDEAEDSTAVIVTERLVREFWRDGNPLAQRLEVSDEQRPPSGLDLLGTFDHRAMIMSRRTFEAVGVFIDVKIVFAMEDPRRGVFPTALCGLRSALPSGVTLMVRADSGGDITGAVQARDLRHR